MGGNENCTIKINKMSAVLTVKKITNCKSNGTSDHRKVIGVATSNK